MAKRQGRWEGTGWRDCRTPQKVLGHCSFFFTWRLDCELELKRIRVHLALKQLMYVCQGWNISFPEKKGDNLVAIATVQDSCTGTTGLEGKRTELSALSLGAASETRSWFYDAAEHGATFQDLQVAALAVVPR